MLWKYASCVICTLLRAKLSHDEKQVLTVHTLYYNSLITGWVNSVTAFGAAWGMVWRRQSVCLILYKMLVLVWGLVFYFLANLRSLFVGCFTLVFWCFTKGYALWNSESFWLTDETELILPTVMLLSAVCLHSQSPARMGRLGRGGSLCCGLLSVLSSALQRNKICMQLCTHLYCIFSDWSQTTSDWRMPGQSSALGLSWGALVGLCLCTPLTQLCCLCQLTAQELPGFTCRAVWEQGKAFSVLSSLEVEVPSWSPECQCHSLNNICFPLLGRGSLSVLCSHGRLPTAFLWFPHGSPSPCLEVFRLSADCVSIASFQITLWDPETGWQQQDQLSFAKEVLCLLGSNISF